MLTKPLLFPYTYGIERMEDSAMFTVGDKIVYPMHGAGIIRDIEVKNILGKNQNYYILKLPGSDMNVMIPVENQEAVGIRDIVSKEKMREVIEFLHGESSRMEQNWNRRYRENMEKLKSDNLMLVAEVVKNLVRADRKKKLSSGERKLLLNAKQILGSEMVLVLDITPSEAETLMEESI